MLAKANPPTRHQGHVRVPVYSSPTGTTYSWETAGARNSPRVLDLAKLR